MEEILKEILKKMSNFETKMDSFETKMDSFETKMDSFETKMDNLEVKTDNLEAKMDSGFESIKERIDMNDRSYREEFRKLDKKMDSMTDAIMHTMENVTELKDKVEKQDAEIRVIKGGKTVKA